MPPRAAVAAAAAAAAAALLLPLGLAPQCRDDEVWRFNGVSSCAEFADNPGAAFCAESWATGADSDNATVTAFEACEISCSNTDGCTAAAQTCGDTDGDGTPDEFDCAGEDRALAVTAAAVECAADSCAAAECCTEPRPEPEPELEPELDLQLEPEPDLARELELDR